MVHIIKPTVGSSWGQVEGVSSPWAALWMHKTPALAEVGKIQGNPAREKRLELDELRPLEASSLSALLKDNTKSL